MLFRYLLPLQRKEVHIVYVSQNTYYWEGLLKSSVNALLYAIFSINVNKVLTPNQNSLKEIIAYTRDEVTPKEKATTYNLEDSEIVQLYDYYILIQICTMDRNQFHKDIINYL